jgi:hypothetical protein
MSQYIYEKYAGGRGLKITQCLQVYPSLRLPSILSYDNILLPVLALGPNLFEGNEELEEVELPNKLENIGSNCFKNCTSLTSISFPKTLKKVDACAFQGCSALSGDVIIPLGCLHIGPFAFAGCCKIDGYVVFNKDSLVPIQHNGTEIYTQFEEDLKCTFLKPANEMSKQERLGLMLIKIIKEICAEGTQMGKPEREHDVKIKLF